MDYLFRIQDFEHIKILADARRLEILRLLMAESRTLSQLGQILDVHPAQVRHHLKQLEASGLVELVDTRVVRGFVEKYYRARAHAYFFQKMILPDNQERETFVILGSHDLALENLAGYFRQRKRNPIELLILPIGSLDGLIALRQGMAQAAGCHLLDPETGEYNLAYVRHLFPDSKITLITLAHREQGLIVAPGNPRQIHGLQDLAREDIQMVNRNKGSGTRLWLDQALERISLTPQELHGYDQEIQTHTGVAKAIHHGEAHVGLGLQAAAHQYGLDFIHLFEERFDLVLLDEQIQKRRSQPLFDHLQSAEFRQALESLGGYRTTKTGDHLSP